MSPGPAIELNKWDQVINATSLAYIVVDLDGNVRGINFAALSALGWSKKDYSNSSGNLLSENDFQKKFSNWLSYFHHGKKIINDFMNFVSSDGSIVGFKIEVSILVDQEQGAAGFLVMLVERFLHALREHQLLNDTSHMLAAFEASPIPIITYALTGVVTYVNPAFESCFGWKKHELLHRKLDFIPESYAHQYQQSSTQLLHSDIITDLDTQRITKDGKAIDINLNSALFRDTEQNPIGSVEILQDISARKEYETELLRAREAADRANQAKGTFLANMSHEIRTPMNAILGYVQILLMESELQEQFGKILNVINQSGQHLLELIDDILDLSRLQAGQTDVQVVPINLKSLIDDVKSLFILRSQAKGLQFNIAIEPNVPQFIKADARKIRQILSNLLSNALKFTDAGSIGLNVRAKYEAPNFPILEFSVSDTGPGIPPERHQSIFQQFYQVPQETRLGGVGLGLTICKEYAQLMDGNITLLSTVGEGSTFTLHCPVQVGEASNHTNKVSIGTTHTEDYTPPEGYLLVVDHETNSRDILFRLLTNAGYSIELAATGFECLAYFRNKNIKCVLIDLDLEDTPSTQVIREIRSLPGGDEVPIIAFSANVIDLERNDDRIRQVDLFLAKPLIHHELLRGIEDLTQIKVARLSRNNVPAISNTNSSESNSRPVSKTTLREIEELATLGQVDRLEELAHEIGRQDQALGKQLLLFINQFDYESIRRLLAET